MKNNKAFTPAKVRYINVSTKDFTKGQIYNAYFVEYWQGVRNSLHVENNSGKITDFNPFEKFEIVCDPENVLNFNEAIIKCITRRYEKDKLLGRLTFGKEYKAIGRDKDGLYLVMDDSWDCYFYPPNCFKIICDANKILQKQSVYYSFNTSLSGKEKYERV